MKIDAATLLTMLAERAKVHQERLQHNLKTGHQQIGRTLEHPRCSTNDEADSVEWALRAQVERAKLTETQALIQLVTHAISTAAQAGKAEV